MSKIYDIEQKTHKLVKQLASQENIKIKIEKPMIQPPEIRQILKAFEGVLGENPDVSFWHNQSKRVTVYDYETAEGIEDFKRIIYAEIKEQELRKDCLTLSQALCQKWLDGLDPMIDSEPEKVLEELNEILKSKIN